MQVFSQILVACGVALLGVTFLSPNKKVTKEVGTGEALMPRYRATNCVLPCVPHPHALGMPRGVLTTRQYNVRLAVGGGSALAALPPSTAVAAMGRGQPLTNLYACRAGARPSLLSRLVLALFLPKQEKGV